MSQSDEDLIIASERGALLRWCQGDPSGFLEISAQEVTYFDPFLERRLEGLAALTAYYEGLRGKISAERFELIEPQVRIMGEVAILSFRFLSWSAGAEQAWSCTEIYRRAESQWKIVHTHWSLAKAA